VGSLNKIEIPADEMEKRFKLLQYKVRERQIEQLWEILALGGFRALLIKGWAAAQFYPEPHSREFVDIDLVLPPEDFDEIQELFSQHTVTVPLDLHCGARHLDKLSFEELYENSVSVKCGNTIIKVPAPEDHLRILAVHWLNDGGASREKLWDIYYLFANRGENFQWERLLYSVGEMRRRWIECAVGLAHKYLGLEIEGTPVEKGAKNLPKWLISAVEKEWASEVKLLPMHYFLNDKAGLWKQIKKRVPPNPIQATIETEGDFDKNPRIWYQVRDIFKRTRPSLDRITDVLKKNKNKL
jgi:hypothetical protein